MPGSMATCTTYTARFAMVHRHRSGFLYYQVSPQPIIEWKVRRMVPKPARILCAGNDSDLLLTRCAVLRQGGI